MIRAFGALLLGLGVGPLLGIGGCSGDVKTAECADNGECDAGNACVKGKCTEVACLASSDCDIFQFCNPFYECQDGCELDTDCKAGETCDTKAHTCTGYGCRSTDLDCAYGEVCNTDTGECKKKGEWCGDCNESNLYSCSSGAYCIAETDGGDGYCWNFCDSDSDCARGFECVELGTGYSNICYGDCDFMTSNGYL